MIVAIIIWSAVSILFVVFGIIARNSKKPAGFWANIEAPEVTDIKGYNKALSNLWFIFAVIFELLGTTFLFGKPNGAFVIVPILGTIMLVLGLMVAYTQIENKYRK